jgi:hypothetical protein
LLAVLVVVAVHLVLTPELVVRVILLASHLAKETPVVLEQLTPQPLGQQAVAVEQLGLVELVAVIMAVAVALEHLLL